ncbi:MAG: 3-oxoacyl-ACP reductase [Bacilli bacterium]|nr:3-oxoacyl-ACP reductase [Bacilli bacterium]
MKWIIVTGDTGGLGSEIVRVLLQSSVYGVIGISRRENEVTDEFKVLYPARYFHICFDLENSDKIKSIFKEIKKISPIFGLVNNSAYAYDDLATNANLESLEKMFRVNTLSPILLTKYSIRDMLLNKTKGSIVHVSSVSAHTGYKGLSMYASTKGAIEAFSKGVSREWGGIGIRSNCVCPGFMETSMSETLTSEQKDRIYKRTSLKTETSTESVARTVEFLLSDSAISITGQVIHVDSGTI